MNAKQKPHYKVWRPTGEIEYFLSGSANVWDEATVDEQ